MPRISLEACSSLVALTLALFAASADFPIARGSIAGSPNQSTPRSSADDPAASGPQAAPDSPKPRTKSKPAGKPARSSKARVRRDPPGFYMGREIAPVMSWEGVDWLFRENRIEQENPEAMLDALKIP